MKYEVCDVKEYVKKSKKRGRWYAWTQTVINLSADWQGVPFVAILDYKFVAELWNFLSKIKGRIGEVQLEIECEDWLIKFEAMKSVMEKKMHEV
ncbi:MULTISPECIES: hypothetical protein [unclassified Archaeoglobus]|jgi:hypothetical protein|uniref:hypothetical protein n=1 Tax=unclassified Archaeoglobus TaxID=2643606 RepID=UPI0025C61BFE|nr:MULTISPECIES: hypothetical protein [unclassified Archaeoglobus]